MIPSSRPPCRPRSPDRSGLNALAHAMEALYAPRLDPVIALLAEESARLIATHLPKVARAAGDLDDVASVLCGAWLAGVCLDRSTMGLHHKLCHVLGGLGLPHAEVHAVILPHVAAFNSTAAPEAMTRLARALGVSDAPAGLRTLAVRVGAPTSLAALGMKESDLDRAAALATENPYENPRPASRAAVRALLGDAFAGSPANTSDGGLP